MSDHTGICIVWPAHFEGSTDPEAHVTALFLGNADNVEYTKEDVRRALGTDFTWGSPGVFHTLGVDMFGKEKDKPVLLLNDGGLSLHYLTFARRLRIAGIEPSTMFPFRPHVTVPDLNVVPKTVQLAAPEIWWGNERVIHPNHAKRQRAVDAGVNAIWSAHGFDPDRSLVTTIVDAALKAVA